MKKERLKKAGIFLLVVLFLIQFFRPNRNLGNDKGNDISHLYPMPDTVHQILISSCYDCHSNSTVYPWYTNIQPVGWWLQNHINDGKRGLNFSQFGTYRIAKQYHRLEDIQKLIKDNSMPLPSYTLIHRYAILSEGQKELISNWAQTVRDTLKSNYPPDSLVMPKRSGAPKN